MALSNYEHYKISPLGSKIIPSLKGSYKNVDIRGIFAETVQGKSWESVKAKNIQRDSRVTMCVDDQTPPFTFIAIKGNAKLIPYKQKEV